MDGRGFDELTKKLAKGASRRSLLKGLLGGAGAVAATAVLKESVAAVPIGGDCTTSDDCDGDLQCLANGKCQCPPNEGTITCGPGTFHQGLDKKPDGTPVWTPLTGLTLMVFFVLAMQCMSTVAVVRRETNSWRWPIFMVVYMTGLAYFA